MPRRYVVITIVIALALGMGAGYLYRRWSNPTLQERAQDAASELKRSVEKLTR